MGQRKKESLVSSAQETGEKGIVAQRGEEEEAGQPPLGIEAQGMETMADTEERRGIEAQENTEISTTGIEAQGTRATERIAMREGIEAHGNEEMRERELDPAAQAGAQRETERVQITTDNVAAASSVTDLGPDLRTTEPQLPPIEQSG